VLHRSIIEKPLVTDSTGSSDIWVGFVNFAAGGRLPWHVQERPYVLGVAEGHVTLTLADGASCNARTSSEGEAFFEPPGVDHEVSNETQHAAAVYFIGFAPSPQPLIAPAAPARGCT
ncbi:MAG: cupin domain-containing protein, partial [Actinobacteria bacterium]|nr:cupin domain-containing protein [Actinomycetota bacterium]